MDLSNYGVNYDSSMLNFMNSDSLVFSRRIITLFNHMSLSEKNLHENKIYLTVLNISKSRFNDYGERINGLNEYLYCHTGYICIPNNTIWFDEHKKKIFIPNNTPVIFDPLLVYYQKNLNYNDNKLGHIVSSYNEYDHLNETATIPDPIHYTADQMNKNNKDPFAYNPIVNNSGEQYIVPYGSLFDKNTQLGVKNVRFENYSMIFRGLESDEFHKRTLETKILEVITHLKYICERSGFNSFYITFDYHMGFKVDDRFVYTHIDALNPKSANDYHNFKCQLMYVMKESSILYEKLMDEGLIKNLRLVLKITESDTAIMIHDSYKNGAKITFKTNYDETTREINDNFIDNYGGF